MYTVAMAYCGSGNNKAIRRLLHVAVSILTLSCIEMKGKVSRWTLDVLMTITPTPHSHHQWSQIHILFHWIQSAITEHQVHCPKGTHILMGSDSSLHRGILATFYKAVLLTSLHSQDSTFLYFQYQLSPCGSWGNPLFPYFCLFSDLF